MSLRPAENPLIANFSQCQPITRMVLAAPFHVLLCGHYKAISDRSNYRDMAAMLAIRPSRPGMALAI